MKKLLLLSALLGTASMSMSAEDVSPTYFNFNQTDAAKLEKMVRHDISSPKLAHLDGNNFVQKSLVTYNGTDAYEHNFTQAELNDGVILMGGITRGNVLSREKMKSGLSICDFGGDIGKVLVLNGINSQLNEYIKTDLIGEEGAVAPQIPKSQFAADGGNLMLFFLFKGNTDAVKVTMDICAFNNEKNSSGNVFSGANMLVQYSGANKVDGKTYTFSDFSSNSETTLNGYTWKTYAFYNNDIQSFNAFKMVVPGVSLDNGALLIRNIKVESAPENTTSGLTESETKFTKASNIQPTGVTFYPANNKFFVGKSTPIFALVEPVTANVASLNTTYTALESFGSFNENVFTATKSNVEGVSVSATGTVTGNASFNIYDPVEGIEISHRQKAEDNLIHLTVGENTIIDYKLLPEGGNFDPETTINVKVGDSFSHAKLGFLNRASHSNANGEMSINVRSGAGTSIKGDPISVSVSAIKVNDNEQKDDGSGNGNMIGSYASTSATMNVHHYGVSMGIAMNYSQTHNDFESNKQYYIDQEESNVIQLKNAADGSVTQNFKPYVHNANLNNSLPGTFNEVSYQMWDMSVSNKEQDVEPSEDGTYTIDGIATLKKEGDMLVVTSLAEQSNRDIKVTINAYTAGVYNARPVVETQTYMLNDEPMAVADTMTPAVSKTYTVFQSADGTTGISDIAADDANLPVVLYNLQGVRVDNPAPGVYISRQGNKATKVVVK